MTERDELYTPSDASVRIAFVYVEDGQSERLTREREAAFDRWLAAHDESVRQEERERCAQIAGHHGPIGPTIAARIREH